MTRSLPYQLLMSLKK